MLFSLEDKQEIWAVIGPNFLITALDPLHNERRRHGATALIPGDPHDLEKVAATLGARPAVLLVVEDPADPSIRPRYSSPFLARDDGPDVLLGWLRFGHRELAAYALRATALLRRRSEGLQTVVLLGPRERRYLDLLDELDRTAESSSDLSVFRWSAERIRRPTLVQALRLGAAAVFYSGHGSVDGWFAYGGLGADQFVAEDNWSNDQINALAFSLACGTGKPCLPGIDGRLGTGRGFGDHMVGVGAIGAILAPLGNPMHVDNCRLAISLLRALANGRRRLRDILEAARTENVSLQEYVVIGDPALCATAALGARQHGEKVFAPAAEANLGSEIDSTRRSLQPDGQP